MKNHHISKRKQRVTMLITYSVMTSVVVITSFICIMLVLGYRFNITERTVAQGGLAQFRSFPTNANILLDGKKLSYKTPGKQSLSAGQHSAEFTLSGYHTWRATFGINPGQLRWLNYARLVPTNPQTTGVKSFDSIASAVASPDRQWIAILPSSQKAEIIVADIRNPQKPQFKTVVLPAGTFKSAALNIAIKEWDFGSKYILLSSGGGAGKEYVKFDKSSAESAVNVTSKLNLNFEDLCFSGTSGHQFYGLVGKDIRKLDINGDGSVSGALVSGVESFEIYKEDYLGYVAVGEDKKVAGVYKGGKNHVARTYALDQKINVDIAGYYDHIYLAIALPNSLEVVKDPTNSEAAAASDTIHAKVGLKFAPGWVMFSNGGRFAVAGNGNNFVTYDLETDEQFASSLSAASPTDGAKAPLWIDDYYLATDAGNQLTIGEFNGDNQHVVANVVAGYAATLSDDGKYMFTIGLASGGGLQLQSTKMVIN